MPGFKFIRSQPVYGKDYQKLLYRQGNDHFIAYSRLDREPNGDYKRWDVKKIAPQDYCPVASAAIKIAPSSLLATSHIKYPHLDLWAPDLHKTASAITKTRTSREVSICEIIAQNPHPNIAKYHGCIVEDGFIKGIVFEKYEETLYDKVNPGWVSKKSFQYGEYPLQRGRDAFITEMKSAMDHLHSLGLVHNDIKPTNCMLSFDGTAVLIDFDSCLPIGASCRYVGRTEGWCDLEKELSHPSNDAMALDDIIEWLGDVKAEVRHYFFELEEEGL